jgi:hypothetical protein
LARQLFIGIDFQFEAALLCEPMSETYKFETCLFSLVTAPQKHCAQLFPLLRKAWGLFSYVLLSSLTNLIHLVMISVTGSDTDVRCYKSDSTNTDIEPGFAKIDMFSFSEKRIIISAIVTLFPGLGRFLYGSFRQSFFNEFK